MSAPGWPRERIRTNPTPEVLDMCSLKRNLIGFSALLAMALAVAAGTSFVRSAHAQQQAQPQPQPQQQPGQAQPQPQQQPGQAQPQPSQSQASATFTGTVVKNGEQYMLRDSTGQIFGLDDSDKAKQFEGKTVKVTGQLDTEAKVIHVQDIQAAEA
jgi:uncharacterized protein YdeI (BOF family)